MPLKAHMFSEAAQIWLPETICDSFEAAFGLVWDSTASLYLINETLHTSLLSRDITVNFTIGDQANKVTFDFPYSMFDLTIGPSRVKNKSRYFPLRRANSTWQYSLGRAFMQRAYITADFDRRTFNISRALFSNETDNRIFAIPPPANNTSAKNGQTKKSSINTASIAAISVGVSAIFIALGLFFYRRLRRKPAKDAVTTEDEKPNSPDIGVFKHELEGEGKPRMELDAYDNEKRELESIVVLAELEGTEISPTELPASVPIYEVREGRKYSF
jgi:hypothetical protein